MIEKLVTVKHCSNPFEASFLQAYLENHGIRVHNSGDDLRSWTGRYSMLSRGIRLQVFARDAVKAEQLLENPPEHHGEEEETESGEEETASGGPPETIAPNGDLTRCPNCGSTNIEELRTPPLLRILSIIFLLGLPLLFSRRVWICRDCDWDSSRGAGTPRAGES